MVYNFKEYKPVFDTPLKVEQELAVSRKIMDLLNKNRYNDLEDFISKNSSYQNFLNNNQMENVVKHFGNSLNEADYVIILNNLRSLTKTKKEFEKENIKTTNFDDKEYNSFSGGDKTYFLDNSVSDKSIEEQMKDLQNSSDSFQTSDIRKNTENMFKSLEENTKEGLNLLYLSQINFDSLSLEEKELYSIAADYQNSLNEPIRIDLKRGIIVDGKDNIMKLKKENGEFSIIDDTDDEKTSNTEEVSYQKVLTPAKDTIYNS